MRFEIHKNRCCDNFIFVSALPGYNYISSPVAAGPCTADRLQPTATASYYTTDYCSTIQAAPVAGHMIAGHMTANGSIATVVGGQRSEPTSMSGLSTSPVQCEQYIIQRAVQTNGPTTITTNQNQGLLSIQDYPGMDFGKSFRYSFTILQVFWCIL